MSAKRSTRNARVATVISHLELKGFTGPIYQRTDAQACRLSIPGYRLRVHHTKSDTHYVPDVEVVRIHKGPAAKLVILALQSCQAIDVVVIHASKKS